MSYCHVNFFKLLPLFIISVCMLTFNFYNSLPVSFSFSISFIVFPSLSLIGCLLFQSLDRVPTRYFLQKASSSYHPSLENSNVHTLMLHPLHKQWLGNRVSFFQTSWDYHITKHRLVIFCSITTITFCVTVFWKSLIIFSAPLHLLFSTVWELFFHSFWFQLKCISSKHLNISHVVGTLLEDYA